MSISNVAYQNELGKLPIPTGNRVSYNYEFSLKQRWPRPKNQQVTIGLNIF